MALNVSEARTVFQSELDKQMAEELTSAWMDGNAGQIIYNGGSEVKIPILDMDGLKGYSRKDGYPSGGVDLTYQTMTMKMDRGAGFNLDAMDVNETNFVAAAGTVLGEFQRTKVVPEVDAYRYSKIHKILADDSASSANIVSRDLTTANAYQSISDDIQSIRDEIGDNVPLVVVINGKARGLLNKTKEFTRTLNQTEFKNGSITSKVRTVDECPIIQVPSERMYNEYDFWAGSESGKEKGGFAKKSTAKLMNYIIIPRTAPIGVCKQDKGKIIIPDLNQKADAWFIGYRKFHDLWIKASQLKAIRICEATK